MGSWKGGGNQYIQLVKVLYCKLPSNGKQLPAFQARLRTEPRPQRWEARVLPLYHRGPLMLRGKPIHKVDVKVHKASFGKDFLYI